ncbi:hypothetical protein [Halorubrum sp. CGM5_25_10-8B]|uniref:hypothetical protein n=1 Tax=Halorubrum sp. CGM5_25_10-8B TaxID=2518115 RepID=UPI001F5412D8|nr:hypothetical protein [Halorubrum sp. CGM5_25_10-8B]
MSTEPTTTSDTESSTSTETETEAETEATAEGENKNTNDTQHANRADTASGVTGRPAVALADLLTRETDIKFAGLTETDSGSYPDEIPPETRCLADSPRSFKEAIRVLPKASPGELWATNDFVETSGRVDTTAIRDVHGLDIDALEAATGRSLEDLAAGSSADAVVRVRDHKDIVDDRRKALNALGYDVKFRWQIASDSYSIINPQDAYLPIISALQQRGETDAFGWVSYRDWGGLLKMVVICPSLRHVVSNGEADLENAVDEDGLASVVSAAQTDSDTSDAETESDSDAPETVVYGGFQTGYDFRGTQTLWARPILFFPDSGTVLPDMGERYTRRHYGQATNAAHERKQGRVPISEWWRNIYDDIDTRMIEVDIAIRRTRAIAYDFDDLPFSLEDCYTYWGVAFKYAERAAERATSIAKPARRPTVFNIQLSLVIALLEEYKGSMASNSYQEYLEVAGELFRKPAMMIQLAMQEHDRRADSDVDRVLPESQQTLSDALEDIVDIPGISVDTEADLTDQQAQRVQDRLQQRLGDA